MPPIGPDVTVGGDRARAGDVPPGEQLAGGDLVVDGEGEDQAGAGSADLLAEVEGDRGRVGVARAERDADDGDPGLASSTRRWSP